MTPYNEQLLLNCFLIQIISLKKGKIYFFDFYFRVHLYLLTCVDTEENDFPSKSKKVLPLKQKLHTKKSKEKKDFFIDKVNFSIEESFRSDQSGQLLF